MPRNRLSRTILGGQRSRFDGPATSAKALERCSRGDHEMMVWVTAIKNSTHQFTYAELEHHHNGKNCLDGVAVELLERLFEEDEQRDNHQRQTHLPHKDDLSRIGLTHLNCPARDMLHGSAPTDNSVGD
ncbi:hypothetical protein TB2_002270 [Malus domestica]